MCHCTAIMMAGRLQWACHSLLIFMPRLRLIVLFLSHFFPFFIYFSLILLISISLFDTRWFIFLFSWKKKRFSKMLQLKQLFRKTKTSQRIQSEKKWIKKKIPNLCIILMDLWDRCHCSTYYVLMRAISIWIATRLAEWSATSRCPLRLHDNPQPTSNSIRLFAFHFCDFAINFL